MKLTEKKITDEIKSLIVKGEEVLKTKWSPLDMGIR